MSTIIGVKLENRVENSLDFQRVLTDYGCDIKTRLGLHQTDENSCTNYGLVLLEVTRKSDEIAQKLSAFGTVQMMKF